MYASSETESISADPGLIVGDADIENKLVTLLSGEGVFADYSVVGKITASGKYSLCDIGAADGSEVPSGILVYGGDATAADVDVQMYTMGVFNSEKLVWHASFNTDALKTGAFPVGSSLMVKKVEPIV